MSVAKRVVENRFFNFDTQIKNVKGKSYDFIVKAFKKRIEKWFIYPADIIVARDKTEGHLAFPVLLIDCSLIECLCQFHYGKKESRSNDYKTFLRLIIKDFSQKLKRKNTIKGKPLRDYADIFYFAFRCGLMHSAMIKPCGGIVGQSKILQYNAIQGILTIQPILFHEEIKKIFYGYVETLLKKTNKGVIARFRKKMWIDFAVRVPIL